MNDKDAIIKLEKLDLDYQIILVEGEENKIVKTIPYGGTNIKKNTCVDVYVGTKLNEVYSGFLGLEYDKVCDEINDICKRHNINLVVEYEQCLDFINGVIIYESIPIGTTLEDCSELKIKVSKNDEYFLMPNLVGLSIYEALDILNEYNIKPIINYLSSPVDIDVVLFQSIVKDQIVKKGNIYEMTLYVSNGLSLS